MTWATAADVLSLTGKVVEDDVIQMATGIVEMNSGILQAATSGVTSPGTRNLEWLRRAISYQAAFMVEYPDYFSRMDVSTFTQDGASAALKTDALTLSPLAKKCIRRLSWRGTRTIQPTTGRPITSRAPYTSDDFDDNLPWKAS